MNYHVVFANRRSQICIDLRYTAKGNEKGHPKYWAENNRCIVDLDRSMTVGEQRNVWGWLEGRFQWFLLRILPGKLSRKLVLPNTIGIWSTLGYQESMDCVFCRVSGASVGNVMCPYTTVQKPVAWWFENSIQFYSISWGLSMHWEFRENQRPMKWPFFWSHSWCPGEHSA